MSPPASSAKGTGTPPSEVIAYWRYRRRTVRALFAVLAALVAVVTFRNPAAWGDGQTALLAYRIGWVTIVIGLLVAFRWNGLMAELSGYCLGKYGRRPWEIVGPVSPTSDRAREA